MHRCEVCGQDLDLPFKCTYCGRYFCAEHRIPENHNCENKPLVAAAGISAPRFLKERTRNIGICPKCHQDSSTIIKDKKDGIIFRCQHCGLVYGQKTIFPYHYFRVRRRKQTTKVLPEETIKVTPYEELEINPVSYKRKKSYKKILLAILFLVILVTSLIFLSLNNPFSSNSVSNVEPNEDLVNYALSLINIDRQINGLQNVSLSSINSGQSHADDMLKNGYFSHWDMNGYKPYMRYTLAGGKGAVAENCAWEWQTGNVFGIDVKSALKDLEWNMMYNDSASGWGHKDNILNPIHSRVSIGIAYDHNHVYFVEDFEDDYISWSQLSVDNNEVAMQGIIQSQQTNIQQIAVYYDNPSPLTVNQLNNPPYQHSYDAGTLVAIVVPPLPAGQYYDWSGITEEGIVANNWTQNGNDFQISFSLSQIVVINGKGVYTLYLYTGSDPVDCITTHSIWIS